MRWTAAIPSLSPLLAFLVLSCGGGDGGGGGTAPPVVASVEVSGTLPAVFQTLGRTATLSAVARDAAGAAIGSASISWSSTNTAVATVSGTGFVTAVGNGSAQITATSGGVPSAARAVAVTQVAATINVNTGTVAFGAIGSTRQLVGTVVDSGGATVASATAPAWTRAGSGATASVSPVGLATALAVGASDTAVATSGSFTQRVPISVTQVVANILLSSTGSDTLRTTGRTKQYSAVPRDSQNNSVAGVTVGWTSSATGVATVGAGTGLAAAVADGNTNIVATANAVTAQRALTIRRFASAFSMNPNAASIATALGTQGFTATAQDSVATNLPITWASRTTSVATLNNTTGTAVTAMAAGNGSSYIVMSAGTRADSALLTVTGQATAPISASVTVGDFFFRSVRNSTENQAIDTVAVGGTVTWTWNGSALHSVLSGGSPSFSGSGTQTSGTFQATFGTLGTYLYSCSVHPAMTGRVVVR